MMDWVTTTCEKENMRKYRFSDFLISLREPIRLVPMWPRLEGDLADMSKGIVLLHVGVYASSQP